MMFVFLRVIALLGAISTLTAATPVPSQPVPRTLGILCSLPIVRQLCRKDAGEVDVLTAVGMARGFQATTNTSRFSVRYASASRWGLPVKANVWAVPGNDITKLPPACPQPYADPSTYSEDCLHLVIYTPVPNPSIFNVVPVLVWVHGGSFVIGSASGDGLDGAKLAKATNSIVVVPQYRLGALGFVPPSSMSGNINLGVRDVITALQFIRQTLPAFGGDINQITVAGQSSGGQMVRALLATPSASGLFRYAAIHSDPMDYGFYKPQTIADLSGYLYTNTTGPLAQCTTVQCQQSVAVSDVLDAQGQLLNVAGGLFPVTYGGSPLRPVHDGQLIQFTLTGNSFPPSSSMKPVLVTTIKSEAAPTVEKMMFPQAVPAVYVDGTILQLYDSSRSNKIISSENYDPNAYGAQAGLPAGDEARSALVQLFTDNLWRCPSWTFSRNWVSKGSVAYTGEFQLGATYPDNQGLTLCGPNQTCHEDDIYIIFGTTPSPTPAQTALTQEIQARISAFVRTGYPNPSSGGYATWAQSGTSDVAALKLGGTGNRAAEACDPSFWGAEVPYSYQIYGL